LAWIQDNIKIQLSVFV